MMDLIKQMTAFSDEMQRLKRMLNKFDRNVSILDVGCGTGRNLELLKEMDFANMVGVDINPDMVESCRLKGFTAYLSSEMDLSDRKWDVILMSHIVEHLDHVRLQEFIELHLGAMRAGGRLIICTPLLTQAFYNDFDHIKPYCPAGFIMVFSPATAQVQRQSKWALEIRDLAFYKAPWRIQWHPTFYLKDGARWPHLVNRIGRVVFYLSAGRLGSKAGWIGQFALGASLGDAPDE